MKHGTVRRGFAPEEPLRFTVKHWRNRKTGAYIVHVFDDEGTEHERQIAYSEPSRDSLIAMLCDSYATDDVVAMNYAL